MNREIDENAQYQASVYKDIELSEKQIENGQVKDARKALAEKKEKYDL